MKEAERARGPQAAQTGASAAQEVIRPQAAVLTARYRAILLADWPTLLLLLLQAPLIGWMCTLVWGSVETDTPSLRFVLCLSALWFGCIDACREIVKERAIVERERLFGLSMAAYVRSKVVVLAGLVFLQVVLLQLAVEWSLALRGPYVLQTLVLWLAGLAGVGLGLAVSAFSSSQERAVGAIPLLILPQILFSEFSIPRDTFGDVVRWVEYLMPVSWAYKAFAASADKEPDWLAFLGDAAVVPGYLGLLAVLAVLLLQERREVT